MSGRRRFNMKRVVSVGLLVSLCWGWTAIAAVYQSDFGFRLDLPSGWTIVSKKGVKEKPEFVAAVFEAAEKDRTLADMPEHLYTRLKEIIAGGEVEYYYKTDSPSFSISVFQQPGTLPQNSEAVQETCQALPEDLSKLSKNPVRVYECRSTTMRNGPALYIVADAYEKGEKYVEYLIQKGPDQLLLFTATSTKQQDFDKLKAQFDEIMKSFQKM
jgi:hypothetical protein